MFLHLPADGWVSPKLAPPHTYLKWEVGMTIIFLAVSCFSSGRGAPRGTPSHEMSVLRVCSLNHASKQHSMTLNTPRQPLMQGFNRLSTQQNDIWHTNNTRSSWSRSFASVKLHHKQQKEPKQAICRLVFSPYAIWSQSVSW